MGLDMKAKKNLTREIAGRYRRSSLKSKGRILDEFIQTTGYNRKYAIHLLANWGKKRIIKLEGKIVEVEVGRPKYKKRKGHRKYGAKIREAVHQIWKFFDFMCGKRLVVIIRMNIEILLHQPELKIDETMREDLLSISPATIDRILKPERKKYKIKGRSHTKHGPLLKHQIPIRTNFEWNEQKPGFFELDTVGHDGGSSSGEFCYTLNATDVSSGWVCLKALRNRAHRWVKEEVQNIRKELPFPLKGIDSDNGGEFINYALLNYCKDTGIVFTRTRSYRKNDNCFVEQKNDIAIRRTVGYYRYDTEAEYEALKEVYKHLCPLLNFYYPSVRLISKERIGAKVKKKYDVPKPPVMRLLESKDVDDADKVKLRKQLKQIHIMKQKKLVDEAVKRLIRLFDDKNQKTLPF